MFLALSFAGPDSDRNLVPRAVAAATDKAGQAFLAEVDMRAEMHLGEVMYRDLPKGAEPVEMLVAAAQSMSPLTPRDGAKSRLH